MWDREEKKSREGDKSEGRGRWKMGFGRVSGVIELRWYLGIWVFGLLFAPWHLFENKAGKGEGGPKGRIVWNNEKT